MLLLEDDASFKEVIRDFLTENGYTVVAVANGGEGIREVMEHDFSLILCDLMMPTLAGDMFYRAVQRIRPSLCERFVFMSGYRGDAKTNEFIRAFNVTVLRKPFHLKDLLDTIAFTEARSGLQDAYDAVASQPVLPLHFPPVNPARAELPPTPPVAAAPPPVVVPVARTPAEPVLFRPPPIVPASAPPASESLVSRRFRHAGFAVFLGLGLIVGLRFLDARDRVAAAGSERVAIEAEWRAVAAQAEQAGKARANAVSVLTRAERIEAERAAGQWTEVLRAGSMTASAGIELRSVAARGFEGSPGASELAVEGVAIGASPRGVADAFLHDLRRELERQFPGGVRSELVKLEDAAVPASAPAGQRAASFAIVVKVGVKEAPKVERPVVK